MTTRALVIGLGLGALAWYAMGYTGVTDGDGTGAEGGDVVTDGTDIGVIDSIVNTAENMMSSNPSTMSDAGLSMLAQFEGFSATPYPDYKGQSIGYGHLIKAGESFASVSQDQALSMLRDDAAQAERTVTACVAVPVNQGQFDALVSLCYNIGGNAFRRSTLVKLLNEGDTTGAAEQFSRWNRAGGQINDALVARRATEQALFASGVYV